MRECAGRLAALIVGLAAAHSAHAGENLDGFWMDSDGEVILNIGPCGDARCGKVAWLKKPRGADGAPLRDYKNPDAKSAIALRVRPARGHRLQEAA